MLYSFLGCVSYFILVKFSDLTVRKQDSLVQFQVFLAFLFLFNGIGLSVRCITDRLKVSSSDFRKNRRWFMRAVFVAALSLLFINYGLLICAKLMIGHPHPFVVKYEALRILLLVWLIELVIMALSMSSHFYKDMAGLYKKAKDLEQANLQARYTALQKQLNPHFLFNSLNVLIAEIEYNPQNAVTFTRNLSDTYRYILLCQDKKLVPLEEEIRFLDTYVNLHRTRLGECIRVHTLLPEREEEWRVPPLTLQLLVENVIKHNVISMAHPMTITVRVIRQDGQDWLTVSNPVRPKQGAGGTGKGLENLSVRYQLLCRRDIEILKEREQFTVKVPLIL